MCPRGTRLAFRRLLCSKRATGCAGFPAVARAVQSSILHQASPIRSSSSLPSDPHPLLCSSPVPIPSTLASPSSVYLAFIDNYFYLFVLRRPMPPKGIAKPRSWGNRFDPLGQPRTPSPARQPASPLRIPASGFSASKLSPLQATFTPLNSSRRRDERTPHDASVFVGRYFLIRTSLYLIEG